MYAFDTMIDLALRDGQEWSSDIHRTIAVKACIANPAVRMMDTLRNNVNIINNIPHERIKEVTFQDLVDMGCWIGGVVWD